LHVLSFNLTNSIRRRVWCVFWWYHFRFRFQSVYKYQPCSLRSQLGWLKTDDMDEIKLPGYKFHMKNRNLTWCKNDQHSKIYLPCNSEVNLITHLGVIALFSSNFFNFNIFQYPQNKNTCLLSLWKFWISSFSASLFGCRYHIWRFEAWVFTSAVVNV
jgi:hypothetical protein